MGKKILVLDDDVDLLEIMDIVLTGDGYQVLTLNKGDFLTENITQFDPDLILMDVMLAGMDGRALCKHIKSNPDFAMPVILISGTHDLQQVMHQKRCAGRFYIKTI